MAFWISKQVYLSILYVLGKTGLVDMKDNGDGTYTVNYSPSVEGSHSLMVRYADDESLSR